MSLEARSSLWRDFLAGMARNIGSRRLAAILGDVARLHGGDIGLEPSSLRGLRATLDVPGTAEERS